MRRKCDSDEETGRQEGGKHDTGDEADLSRWKS